MAPEFKSVVIRDYADVQLGKALNSENCKLILLTGGSGCGKSRFMRDYLKVHEAYLNQKGTYFASLNAALIESTAQLEEGLRRITRHYRADLMQGFPEKEAPGSSPYQNLQRLCVIFEDVAYSPCQPLLLNAVKDLCENGTLTLILLLDGELLLSSLEGGARKQAAALLDTLYGTGECIDVNAAPAAFPPSCLNRVFKEIIEESSASPLFDTTYDREIFNGRQGAGNWNAYLQDSVTYLRKELLTHSDALFMPLLRKCSSPDLRRFKTLCGAFFTLAPYYLISHRRGTELTRRVLSRLLLGLIWTVFYEEHSQGDAGDENDALFSLLASLVDLPQFSGSGLGRKLSELLHKTDLYPVNRKRPNPDLASDATLTETHLSFTDLPRKLQKRLKDYYARHFSFTEAKAEAEAAKIFLSSEGLTLTLHILGLMLVCSSLDAYLRHRTFSADITFYLLENENLDFSFISDQPLTVPEGFLSADEDETPEAATDTQE